MQIKIATPRFVSFGGLDTGRIESLDWKKVSPLTENIINMVSPITENKINLVSSIIFRIFAVDFK